MGKYFKLGTDVLSEKLRASKIEDTFVEVIEFLENKYNADFVQFISGLGIVPVKGAFIMKRRGISHGDEKVIDTKEIIHQCSIHSIKPIIINGVPLIEIEVCEPESGCLDIYRTNEILTNEEGDLLGDFALVEYRTFEGVKIPQ